jgi:membrane associated rhomboid family serine protease
MTEMRLVSAAELRDIESNPTAPPVIGRRGDTLNDSNASASTSRRSTIVRRMMSLSSAVPTFIANVNREITRTQHFVNQTQRRVFDAIDGRRNPSRNNDSNDSNTNSNNNNGSSSDNNNQQQQNGSYWMHNEEIPPELPSTYRSIQTGPPIRRGDSWFYPVAPSRDEAAFHERNNFGFRNPQTHQNWIEIRRDGDAVETAVAYRVSLRLLPVMRNQQHVRWVFLFAVLLSMMYGVQIVFCNSASWSTDGNAFMGPSKFEMAKSSCIAGNLGWLVTEKTEIWRLFTSIFAVGNVVTFVITLLALLFIAAPIERNIGGYIAIPLFCGPFVGILASTYFLNDHVTTGGLSSIAAILPLCYADYWKTKELSFIHCFGFAIFIIVILFGYSPFTDNLTQLFAFLFGAATAGIYYSPERPSLTSEQVKSAQSGFAILLGFIFVLPFLLLCVGSPMKSGGLDTNSVVDGFACMPSEMMGSCRDDVLTWQEYYGIPPSPEATPISPPLPSPPPPPPSPPPSD